MAEKDWQVGPVLKNKLGSQGTLFRGGTKYASPARYPRGYTPERQAEVREAVQPAPFTAKTNTIHPVVDTLARSTAPAEHLKNVKWAVAEPGQALTSAEAQGKESVAGVYLPPWTEEGQSTIALKPYATRSSTVLHELGHHRSYMLDNPWQKKYSYEAPEGGHEEAFADNYAEQHFRDQRGRPVDRGTYGGGQWAGRIQRSDEFWGGYHSHRDNTMYRASVAEQDEEYFRRYPEERHGDEPLLTKEWISEDDRKRGVKSTTEINWRALPDA